MDDNPNLISIFWIESHKQTEKLDSFILDSKNQKTGVQPIYQIKEPNNFINIFNYFSERKDYEFTFISEYVANNKTKYDRKTQLKLGKVKDDYYFLYNFIFMENIPSEKQFRIYLEMIEKKYGNDGFKMAQMKEILFNNTRSLLNDTKEYFDFSLYLSLFIESYTYKKFIRSFFIFFIGQSKKTFKIIKLENERLDKIKKVLNEITNNPKLVLMHFDENKKESIKILIYKIIFSFNIYFQKEKIRENLKNKNINDIIYKLILDEFAYFKNNDLLLNAEELSELIKYANNFEKIGNFFDFNHNFDDLLKAINNNCDFVIKKFGESIYEEPLKLDNYIIPIMKNL